MDRIVQLPVRFSPAHAEFCDVRNEADIFYKDMTLPLGTTQTAMVLVDCWDRHYLTSHAERGAMIAREHIAPALAACRDVGITIVHAPSPWVAKRYPDFRWKSAEGWEEPPMAMQPSDWPPADFRRREGEYAAFAKPAGAILASWKKMQPERRIIHDIAPVQGDYVVATGAELNQLCKEKGILHLIYAGFATNVCVLWYRDYSIMPMAARGYNIILLRDCTAALETWYTVAIVGGEARAAAILLVEMMMGFSTDSRDLISACREARVED